VSYTNWNCADDQGLSIAPTSVPKSRATAGLSQCTSDAVGIDRAQPSKSKPAVRSVEKFSPLIQIMSMAPVGGAGAILGEHLVDHVDRVGDRHPPPRDTEAVLQHRPVGVVDEAVDRLRTSPQVPVHRLTARSSKHTLPVVRIENSRPGPRWPCTGTG